MVLNSGSPLRNSRFNLSDSVLADELGKTLRIELGTSRRATKTLMRWAGVSDRTARSWLHGRVSPSGSHLLALAANSLPVMLVVLKYTGYEGLEINLRIEDIEYSLLQALASVRAIRNDNSH